MERHKIKQLKFNKMPFHIGYFKKRPNNLPKDMSFVLSKENRTGLRRGPV